MLRATTELAALLAVFTAPAVIAADEPAPLKFAWPVPSHVRVTEKVEKKGRTTVMHYQASLVAVGGRLELRLSDIQLAQPAGALMPDWLVDILQATLVLSREGILEEVVGFERAIEAGIAMAKSSITDPQTLKGVEGFFRSPQIVAALKRKSSEYWELWVGIWHRAELRPGEEFTTDLPIPMPDGTVLKQPTRIRHLGPDPEVKGHVRLSFEGTLEGPAFATAMERLLKDLMKDFPTKDAPTGSFLESARRETRLSVITETSTMRPREARSEMTTTVVVKGGETKTQVERREYTFDWGK